MNQIDIEMPVELSDGRPMTIVSVNHKRGIIAASLDGAAAIGLNLVFHFHQVGGAPQDFTSVATLGEDVRLRNITFEGVLGARDAYQQVRTIAGGITASLKQALTVGLKERSPAPLLDWARRHTFADVVPAQPERLTITVDGPQGSGKTILAEWLRNNVPPRIRRPYENLAVRLEPQIVEMREGRRFDMRADAFLD